MKKLSALLLLLIFLSPALYGEIFVMKNLQIAVGEIIQETDTFIIVKKADNSRGYIRKDQVEYRMPDMKVSELLDKASEYTKKDDIDTAYYFYLAAEFIEPKKSEVIAGLAGCLIKQGDYDKALSKVKFGLLWEKNNELILLQAELYSLKSEFDKADEILSKLKKDVPSLIDTVDKLMKENQERRLFEKAKNSTPSIKDFKDKVGNCQDAVDSANKLLEWSKETADDIFISVNLNIYASGSDVTKIKDVEKLRDIVSVVDLKIIVDKEKFSGVKTELTEKDRKLLAYGWYFYISSLYKNANKISIIICYEYTNRKEEKKLVNFAKVVWAGSGKNLSIIYQS